MLHFLQSNDLGLHIRHDIVLVPYTCPRTTFFFFLGQGWSIFTYDEKHVKKKKRTRLQTRAVNDLHVNGELAAVVVEN